MTTPLYGVTPEGFKIKRLVVIKNELEDLFIGEYGDVNTDAQSVIGQIIGIFSKIYADQWENDQNLYYSQYPNSASGVSLDNVVQLNGLTRLPAERTSVVGVATGIENTLIPINSLARTPGNGEVFFSTANAFITRGNSVQNIVNVVQVAAQVYTIVIDAISYIYALPTITFSGPIVSGNVINARINGVNIDPVTYAVSSAATLGDLASKILLKLPLAVASATVVGNTVELVPVLGASVFVNSLSITGGGAPTYSQVFRTPVSTTVIAQYLAAILNTSTKVSAVSNVDNITITATDTDFPYSLNVGTNLTVTQVSSPVPFQAQTFGPIPVPVGSLTDILTPVAGWQSLTNFKAGVTGRFTETDVELRLRRINSLRLSGAATVEAIIARLLQEVPGVTSVIIFENVTMKQTPETVVFSNDFVSGNSIQVTYNGNIIGAVGFTVDQLTTITAVKDLILSQSEVATGTVGGVGNRQIDFTFNLFGEVKFSFSITGGVSQTTYAISGGRPPKSFETVVEGGSDDAVALKIWQTKPAGIETFGNVNNYNGVPIIDSQGNTQQIFFSRATPVYLWADVTLVLNPQETFPVNGQQLVAEAIVAYGNSLGIGEDVFLQRVQAAIFAVPGIASSTVLLARTQEPTDTPTPVAADVIIGDVEISEWDISRITVGF